MRVKGLAQSFFPMTYPIEHNILFMHYHIHVQIALRTEVLESKHQNIELIHYNDVTVIEFSQWTSIDRANSISCHENVSQYNFSNTIIRV